MKYSLSVLVVEDDQDVQELIVMKLKSFGVSTKRVNNGYECIEALLDKSYDLILMDLEMPKLNGLETTQRIMDACGSDRPLIFAVTGNTGEAVRQKCMDMGMDGYISKPLSNDKLNEVLQLCVSKNSKIAA